MCEGDAEAFGVSGERLLGGVLIFKHFSESVVSHTVRRVCKVVQRGFKWIISLGSDANSETEIAQSEESIIVSTLIVVRGVHERTGARRVWSRKLR